MVEIFAMPNDLLKLCKRVTAFRPPILVRRQVSGNHGRTLVAVRPGWSADWTKVRATTQVDGRIDHQRLVEVGVSACAKALTKYPQMQTCSRKIRAGRWNRTRSLSGSDNGVRYRWRNIALTPTTMFQ